MKKVVILSASIGGGHNAASNAIRMYAEELKEEYQVTVIDVLEYIRPILSKVAEKTYEINVKNFPEFYGWQYDLNNSMDGKISRNILPFHSKLKELVNEYNPDVIICMHPVSVTSIIRVREKYGFTFKVFVVVTDYDYHASWIHKDVDMFFVSSNFMKLKLLEDHIPETRIRDTGIPTSHELQVKLDKFKARYLLDLKDKKTILIMGGSFGAGNLIKLVNSMMKSNLDLQVIVITGSNKKVKKDLDKLSDEVEKDLIILGYTEKISLYMDAADILVTKPGGLTVTEALIKRLPLVITRPIPGQEEENATYLLNHGIGVRLDQDEELHILIEDLIQDETRLKHMKELQEHYAKPDATKDLFAVMDELLENT
ncbi:glycosyltransferase [Proteiniclasticum sp. C24MP]|uniref:MGDG synthase family glycosyltransferase n=1 Tax=Proteiniclasticum sp. C24MP TaxID=3374101 RepID=UPI003754AE82